MKLIGAVTSPYVRKVRIVMAEKRIEYHLDLEDVWAPDSRIQESNRAFRELLGYGEEELAQLTSLDLTPTRWHAPEAQIIREQVLRRGFSDVYQKELRRKDALLSAMLRNLPFDFWARDAKHRVIMQSDASVRFWGDLVRFPLSEAGFDPATLADWPSFAC